MILLHAFGEGNTRTTAVFTILYLRSLGFEVDNDLFENNSWYFRNALVRANYNNLKKGIAADLSYLEAFFVNLLYGGSNIPLRTVQRELAGISDKIEHKGSSKTGGYFLRRI